MNCHSSNRLPYCMLAGSKDTDKSLNFIVPALDPKLSSYFLPGPPDETPVSMVGGIVRLLPQIPSLFSVLFYAGRPAVTRPVIGKFLTQLRQENRSTPIFVVGYCWGGRYSMMAGGEDADLAKGVVNAVAGLHPSNIKIPAEVENACTPLFVGVGENDNIANAIFVEKVRKIYAEKNVPFASAVYDKVGHGFSVRGDTSKKEVFAAMDQCMKDLFNFFEKYA